MFYLIIVNKTRRHCHSWLAGQYMWLDEYCSVFYLNKEDLSECFRKQIVCQSSFHCFPEQSIYMTFLL